MKTLIHIIPTLENGGAETVLSRLVEELHQQGYAQSVITLQGSDQNFHFAHITQFCEVIHAKNNHRQIKEVFQKSPDAVLLAWMYKAIVYAHSWKYQFKTQQKIFWNIRRSNFQASEVFQKMVLLLFGLFTRWNNPPIIYCAYKAKYHHHRLGFRSLKSKVIQNRLAKKIEFSILSQPPLDTPYVLYVGRYNRAKGPDRLLRLAETYLPQTPKLKLLIAGSGWENVKRPTNTKAQLLFLGNVKDLVPYYQHAQALLFTSYSEGYPNVLVEAAVCGTPIIGFEAGDAALILEQYSLGEIVENEQAFGQQLNHILATPPTQDQRALAAKKARQTFDFKHTVKAYTDFIFPETG